MSASKVPDDIDLDRVQAALSAPQGVHDWLSHARCLGQPYELFFPEERARKAYRPGIAICQGCPVRWDCLAAHLNEKWGCFGGTTDSERKAVRTALEMRAREAA